MATKNKRQMQNVFEDSVETKLDWIADTQLPEGVQLSEVKYINPQQLKINPLNQELFAKESDEYFKSLTQDINVLEFNNNINGYDITNHINDAQTRRTINNN